MPTPIIFRPITKLTERLTNIGIDYTIIKETNSVTYEDELYRAYSSFANGATQDVDTNSYSKSSYPEKRNYLRKFANYPEIEYILDCICDDSVITDEYNRYCDVKFVNEKYQENIREYIKESFSDIYSLLDFDNDNVAWKKYRQWLVDGCLAYEIIYEFKTKEELNDQITKLKQTLIKVNESFTEEKSKIKYNKVIHTNKITKINNGITRFEYILETFANSKFNINGEEKEDLYPIKILGFNEIDPNKLRYVDIRYGEKKLKAWEYEKMIGAKVILSENQVLYIPYLDIDSTGNLSYVERLLRDFNLKRKMEDATVGWFIMNCQSRIKMVVPVGNKTTDKALEALRKFVNHYKETLLIDFDS